ncbi:DUF4432 family protein [Cohnella terricola]|nr:DUF4432 family protein [Cohnella terricola]
MGRCGCEAEETFVEGIRAVRLENERLRAVVLVGKGTDVWELVYKPLETELLMRTAAGLSGLRGRDLAQDRLVHYAEAYPGGWQEIIPNRALFDRGQEEVGADKEGESAGLPWAYRVDHADEREVVLHCWVSLPYVPLAVEKTFVLRAGESALRITERVANTGEQAVRFIWTHHPAFGSPLVGERTEVLLPDGSVAFNVHRYEANRGDPLADYEEETSSVTLPGGGNKDLRRVGPMEKEGAGCYMPIKCPAVGEVGLYQPDLNLKVLLEWDREAFPCVRYWSNTGEGMYTVALEPSSSWFSDIRDCIRHGNCIVLEPGEDRRFWINVRAERP